MGTSKVIEIGKYKVTRFPLVAQSVIDGELTILFSSESEGTVVIESEDRSCELGEHAEDWESCFETSVWRILDSVTITFNS